MKPITKQLAVAALVLACATVVSLGIRQVRFRFHRARHTSSAPASTRPARFESRDVSGLSYSDDRAQLGQVLDGFATQAYRPSDSGAMPGRTDSEDASASGQEAWAGDFSEPYEDSGEQADNVARKKSLKAESAKSKGSKGLQKVSLGDHENVYVTDAGEYWYVSKEADGTTTKMRFQVDDRYGDVVVVGSGEANTYRSSAGGQKGLQRISVGDNEDVYITETGKHWYVTTQPDGTTTKMQFELEDRDGQVIVTGTQEADVYPSK